MKHLLQVAISVSISASICASLIGLSAAPCLAQVEPRLVGTWNMDVGGGSPPRTFRVDGNGHYETTGNGAVIDSGTISMNDGKWKMQSSSGRTDSGGFSIIGGRLQFYNGSLMGQYGRLSSAAPQITPGRPAATAPQITPVRPAAAPQAGAATGQTVQYTESGVEVRTVRPGAYISPTWRRMLGKLKGTPTEWNPAQNHQTPGTGGANTAGTNTGVPSTGGTSTAGLMGTGATGATTSGATTPGGYQYPREQKKFDFDTWAAVQQMNKGQRGPQRVPKGGYIPVMKDNKARKYFNGF